MITTPETPIQLDKQQVEKLATFERRLANVQAEIALANQTIAILRDDINKSAKERAYQEELVTGLRNEAVSASMELNALKESLRSISKEVEDKTEIARTINIANEALASTLKEKDKEISRRELECSAKEEVLTINTQELANEKLSVLAAQDAFLKAVESVSWK